MSSGDGVAKVQTIEQEEALPLTQAAYLPGLAYDEMFAPGGLTRPHYQLLQNRMQTLAAEELAERQQTLERSFLLQGITFTVYGAESA
ncbi:MAG TPA: circularly permuted type 2 ATP-grasp protein, partial [Caulobacteraceae bacterium]|nr:circularly permuted type 2 ATP-grasp protein [Caulobacteraceae bacterium]